MKQYHAGRRALETISVSVDAGIICDFSLLVTDSGRERATIPLEDEPNFLHDGVGDGVTRPNHDVFTSMCRTPGFIHDAERHNQ